jgi:nucleoside-diphosphate-sugar epimerase
VERAARGCCVVFHVASKIELFPLCSAELWRINVGGTENVVRACLEQGICNLIYTSTLDVTWDWNGVVGMMLSRNLFFPLVYM